MQDIQTKAFEYFGALAFVGIGLTFALGYVARKWALALARIEELHALRLADADEAAKVGEAMRVTMSANTTALQANTEVMKLAVSRRRGGAE